MDQEKVEMSLRSWTAKAIGEGSTPIWFLGLCIKILVEGTAAFALAWVGMQAIFLIFPVSALTSYLGATTKPAVWLATGVLVFQATWCKFTSPISV